MISVLWAYFKTSRVHVAALLYFLCAGALTQVPLFNYLGYEFSALFTIPTAFISGFLTIAFVREHMLKPLTRRTWLYILGDYFSVNFILLLIPLGVISLNAIVVKNCNYLKGLEYFILLPVVTMVFSFALALVVGVMFRKARLIFSLLIIGLLSHIVVITYFQPQLFAYNFILGFFPGITYDETISDIVPLIIYRQFTIIASLLLASLFVILTARWGMNVSLTDNFREVKRHSKSDKIFWMLGVFCLVMLAAGHVFRHDLGYEYSANDIQRQLGRRSESDHFIFYYSGRSYSMQDMLRLKAETEFYYQQVTDALMNDKHLVKKVEVYIYPTGEEKRRFIGTFNTNIAKPWRKEIHLTKESFQATFRHELVHVLAAGFGFPVIHASTRMALNEGLAVAIDWKEGMFTPHQYVAALQREKALDHTISLFTVSGFTAQSSAYAYLVSGSFCRYLIDRFGIDRFKHAFANGNFLLSFGETIESLQADWKAFLKTVDTSEIPAETVETLFFQQSIFYKTCAREVAEKNLRAVRAIRMNDYPQAEQQFELSFADAPTAYALRGIFQSLIAQKKYDKVVERFSHFPEHSLLRSNPSLLLLLADACLFDGDNDMANRLYAEIDKMKFSLSFNEAATLRRLMVDDKIDSKIIHTLLYTNMDDSSKIDFLKKKVSTNPGSVSYTYMLAMAQERSGKYSDALNSYQTSLRIRMPIELMYMAAVKSADIYYGMDNFEAAKSLYWEAKNFAPTENLINDLDDQINLCESVALELQ
ncbi:MAG: hypothetical protein PHP42_04170 [Bacteroidota bacterium]|nr:hypothetical protein [Bacteroidota bacterium]